MRSHTLPTQTTIRPRTRWRPDTLTALTTTSLSPCSSSTLSATLSPPSRRFRLDLTRYRHDLRRILACRAGILATMPPRKVSAAPIRMASTRQTTPRTKQSGCTALHGLSSTSTSRTRRLSSRSSGGGRRVRAARWAVTGATTRSTRSLDTTARTGIPPTSWRSRMAVGGRRLCRVETQRSRRGSRSTST